MPFLEHGYEYPFLNTLNSPSCENIVGSIIEATKFIVMDY